MLSKNIESMHKSFGYRFIKGPQSPPAQIYSIGWQIQDSSDYNFNGMKRPDESGNCIFQYTLSGSGMMKVNDNYHILDKSTAFIVSLPSNHTYYYKDGDEPWEFIFITLTGNYAVSEWLNIQKQFGTIIKFKDEEEIIKYLWEIYWTAADSNIQDGYQSSALAYEFIMKLFRSLNYKSTNAVYDNDTIKTSIEFMTNNLSEEISLEDIASVVHMSKFHFNHLFTKAVGISPWNYFTKLRIEHAVKLLLSTKLTIDEISVMSGYTSSNYFIKVFRKYMGSSPGKLREKYSYAHNLTFNL